MCRTLDLLVEWIRRFSYKDFTENGDKTLFKVRSPVYVERVRKN
jgi:hypothetical protein